MFKIIDLQKRSVNHPAQTKNIKERGTINLNPRGDLEVEAEITTKEEDTAPVKEIVLTPLMNETKKIKGVTRTVPGIAQGENERVDLEEITTREVQEIGWSIQINLKVSQSLKVKIKKSKINKNH